MGWTTNIRTEITEAVADHALVLRRLNDAQRKALRALLEALLHDDSRRVSDPTPVYTYMTTTHILESPEVDLAYDVHGPLPTADGRHWEGSFSPSRAWRLR